MDPRSPKRRKTSPGGSVTGKLGISGTPRRTPNRASFLSPTKASLSRFNPNLLPQPRSSPTRTSRPSSRHTTPGRTFSGRESAIASDALAQEHGGPDTSAMSVAANVMDAIVARDFAREALRLSQVMGGSEEDEAGGTPTPAGGNDEEIDLPLTPRARDAAVEEVYTPPRGVLYSSPSKRRRRPGAQLAKNPKDPRIKDILPGVKPKSMQMPEKKPSKIQQGGFPAMTLSKKTGEVEVAPQEKSAAQVHEAIGDDDVRPLRKFTPRVEIIRSKIRPPEDPALVQKRQEKERLARELAQLEKQVNRYQAELDRQQDPNADESSLDELIDLINGAMPDDNAESVPKQPPISQLLTSFLPFAKPQLPPSPPASDLSEKDLPSHAPIELKNPLPYLRLFTPFEFSPKITVPSRNNNSEGPLLQLHTVEITSPQHLMNASISYMLDPLVTRISSISLLHLNPWAEPELGTYVRRKAAENDMNAVSWAFGSYWRVATRRAECWARCVRELDSLATCSGLRQADTSTANTTKKSTAKRKGAQAHKRGAPSNAEQEEDDEDTVLSIDVGNKQGAKITRQELVAHLGRDEMEFSTSNVVFQVRWKIGFDWTGDAESIVTARAAFPKVWHEADERNSLEQVGEAFDQLVEERGVFQAISIMVQLLTA